MAMTSTMQLLVLSFLVIASLFLGATVAPPASLISTPDQALKDKADLIVAKDGSGNFTTVNEAVAAAPENGVKPFVIYIKEGLYKEVIRIGKKKTNLTLVGDGRDLTVLSGDLNFVDGIKTFDSATLAVDGSGFMAQDLCIQNTAGPKKRQAVALRISAEMTVVYRCRIDAYQDTLYAYSGKQFYRDCYITGTVDFIFGRAAAVFQYCQIEARKPGIGQTNILTAQSREKMTLSSGFSFQKCNISASSDLTPIKGTVKTFLGRPWRAFSRIVFMESFIDDAIDPAGWTPWNITDIGTLSTLYYGEYKNTGPGADTSKRVGWKGYHTLTPNEAASFTVENLLQGHLWINASIVPFDLGL